MKIYANVACFFSKVPFPVDKQINWNAVVQELGLDLVDNPENYFKLAAKRLNWKENLSDDPRFALTPIPEDTSEEDRARIEATNQVKIAARQIAQNPQWFVEDAIAQMFLALIYEEKALDVTQRQLGQFQQEFAEQYDIA